MPSVPKTLVITGHNQLNSNIQWFQLGILLLFLISRKLVDVVDYVEVFWLHFLEWVGSRGIKFWHVCYARVSTRHFWMILRYSNVLKSRLFSCSILSRNMQCGMQEKLRLLHSSCE